MQMQTINETVMNFANGLATYGNARRVELDALRKNGSRQADALADYAARQRELEAVEATLFVLAGVGTSIGEVYKHPRAEATQRALARLDLHRVKMATKAYADAASKPAAQST
jgi:hypothetical protein